GISKENLAHIFEAYFTTKQTGTGLGLMIVERIVREHGGSLSVDGGGHDQVGATFTISLPRRDRKIKVLPAPEEV
ncbi:MAG: PAS domain-containing sensor histidine kinase, partial [Lentisphaeria bacterium]|nr:PAS domain-containing sensor histidine kinase [Lentisphaeria bacterium]